MMVAGTRKPRIFTIGHSNLSMDSFLGILSDSSIRLVADIRSNPASSRYPHFERHFLAKQLDDVGISYRWFRELGGRITKKVAGEDDHTALDTADMRRYAAWLNTPAVSSHVNSLVGIASSTVAVLLCAEKDFRHCHRQILSDKLQFMGVRVVHIVNKDEVVDHPLHPDVKEIDDELVYAGRQLKLI